MRKHYKSPRLWSRGFKNAGISILAFLGALQGLKAQVSEYSFSQTTGTFNSISTSTSAILVPGSDATTSTTNDTAGWSVTLPFNFNFNSVDYNSIYVNSNGGAVFGATTSTSSGVISATTAYSGAIGVMNRDLWGVFITSGVTTSGSNVITNVASFKGIEIGKVLNNVNGIPSGATVTAFDETAGTITMSAPATSSSSSAVVRYGSGKVFTDLQGTAPNRVFVIEWIGYNDYSSAVTGSNHLNFQLRLSETTNTISTVYGPSYNVSTTSRTNQIGLRGSTNADYNNRSGAAGNSWNNTSAGTANSSTVSRDNTNFPAAGLAFIWTPPSCISPSALTIASATITPNQAIVSWNASPSAPTNGYEVYYTTTNTAPTTSTVLDATNSETSTTTSATINGLIPSTTYYVWVRSACTGADRSIWTNAGSFTTLCQPPTLLSVTGATICPGNTATLSATADTGATINWYDVSTGGTALSTGNTFTTPTLATTKTYYASASAGSLTSVGILNPSVLTNGGTTTAGTTFYMEATVTNAAVTVQSVDVFPSAAGNQSYIRVYLGTSTTPSYEIPFTSNVASGGTTPQTIPLNLILAPGVYRFKIEGAGSYYRNYSSPGGVGQAFPYGSGDFKLTGGSNVTTGYYLFYNFMVGSFCESGRQAVTATADPAACLGTSETEFTKNGIKIYPNPFSDVLNISDIKNVKSISVMDVAGRIVKNFDKPTSTLQLGSLNSGMYLVVLNMNDGTKQTLKAIKK